MHAELAAFLAEQRWFAGKGRTFEVTAIRTLLRLSESVDISLVEVSYPGSEGGPATTELYQLPLVHYSEPQERLVHAQVWVADEWVYDALHDHEAMAVFLQHFAAGDSPGFHRTGEHQLDPDARSTLFGGEQSNSSVAFGEDSMLKVFRKLTPGGNPDIDIHRALTQDGNTHIATLYGWLEVEEPAAEEPSGEAARGRLLHLAMLQQFLRTSTDGWELAKSSVRNLYGEADLHADEVGGDFAADAQRLGVAVAEVHASLRHTFPTSTADAGELIEVMHRRLANALPDVPELAEHAAALAALYDAAGSGPVTIQRIHGDLHLGQTLRTSLGWKLVDFEGEPARPLAERSLPDLPWRDVAGMLRSFDYAAQAVRADMAHAEDEDAQLDYRAEEWTARNRAAFLEGYLGGREPTPAEQAWLDALEADKAVYEAAYEARNRPTWVGIPLRALHRLTRREP